jgi:acylphosphatase
MNILEEKSAPKPGDWILKEGDSVIAWAEDYGELTKIADKLEPECLYQTKGWKSRFTYHWTNPDWVKHRNQKGAIITVSGNVRGTGFKAMAWNIADKLDLYGIAWNLPDDRRVRIIVEGTKKNIREFTKRIRNQERSIFFIRVTDVRVRWSKATGLYKFFKIIRDENKLAELKLLRRKALLKQVLRQTLWGDSINLARWIP